MRIGTRRSALALAQAELVAGLLREDCEIVPISTRGDRPPGRRGDGAAQGPSAGGAGADDDKSRWVAELEDALAGGSIDLAVHSAKDVPGELAHGLALLGAPARAAVEDVLCGAGCLDELPSGARVGTSSIRRVAQLRAAREDLDLVAIHGNVDTRLRKLAASSPEADHSESLDAIVLARAGLQRLGREAEGGGVLDPARFVPAPGQGVLALEGRADDRRVRDAVLAITDAGALACLLAERALARALDASCHTPLGAHAVRVDSEQMLLRAWVGLPDGSEWVSDELPGAIHDPEALGRRVAERLLAVGAAELLRLAEQPATGA